MKKSIKKRLKEHDDLLKRINSIDHNVSREGLKNKVKELRNRVASEIGKK